MMLLLSTQFWKSQSRSLCHAQNNGEHGVPADAKVKPGDAIKVELPDKPHVPLDRV
jgi:hypothetical protein